MKTNLFTISMNDNGEIVTNHNRVLHKETEEKVSILARKIYQLLTYPKECLGLIDWTSCVSDESLVKFQLTPQELGQVEILEVETGNEPNLVAFTDCLSIESKEKFQLTANELSQVEIIGSNENQATQLVPFDACLVGQAMESFQLTPQELAMVECI